VNNRTPAGKGDPTLFSPFSSAVNADHIGKVFHSPCSKKEVKMVYPTCGPLGNHNPHIHPFLAKNPVQLRKPKVVTDGESQMEGVEFENDRLPSREESFLFSFVGEEMDFVVKCSDLPILFKEVKGVIKIFLLSPEKTPNGRNFVPGNSFLPPHKKIFPQFPLGVVRKVGAERGGPDLRQDCQVSPPFSGFF
jgi:hypothetical protein